MPGAPINILEKILSILKTDVKTDKGYERLMKKN